MTDLSFQPDANACTACGCPGMEVFHSVDRVPVHSTLLMRTREEAVGYTRGDIRLALCPWCGFIRNVAYDPSLQEYCGRIEETQAFSATFNAFHHRLAESLVARHDLAGKTILEIGCGKGEFLNLLCRLGGCRGVGFDPAVVPERNQSGTGDVSFIADFYSERHASYEADFVVCKMTLEHIRDAASFTALALQRNAPTFFMVPNAELVLTETAFWDVYYEHCSYFTPGALARLFRSQGWEVTNLRTEYGDQYLVIEARPGAGENRSVMPLESTLAETRAQVAGFRSNSVRAIADWRRRAEMLHGGKPWVLWGGGSKAVAFLSALGSDAAGVAAAVDINPYKHGCYLPGSGIPVVGPEALRSLRPANVVVMNPIYLREVEAELARLGVHATVEALESAAVGNEVMEP
ncbi:MAG: class I SAM-dependent methyltransferase [Bryobacteraceae bacterium]